MYKVFKTNPDMFVFKKMSLWHEQGEYDGDETIIIDYRKELLSTLIHEVLHYLHPKWEEEKVIKEEILIMNSLSVYQVKNVLKRFSEIL